MPLTVDRDLAALSRRVRRARLARGLTQRQVARRCGAGQVTIVSVEQAKHDPRLLTLLRLARALQVPPSWLLGEGESEVPEVSHPWRR